MKTTTVLISLGVGVAIGASIYYGFFKKDAEGKTFAQRKGWMNAAGVERERYRKYAGPVDYSRIKRLTTNEKNRIAFNEALAKLGN